MSESPQSVVDSDAIAADRPDPAWRALAIGLLVVYFVCAIGFLFVREVVVPRASDWRPEIAAAVGRAIGLPVSIDALSADLTGLRPRLHLSGVLLRDAAGRPALRLETVDATLAGSSLLRGRPHFHRLELQAPELALRREADGRIFVAGVALDMGGADADFSDWLLGQREIVIRDAALTWSDALRGAPELRLDDVNLRVSHIGGRYRVGFNARPPAGLGDTLDVRGDLVSHRPGDLGSWAGQAFVAVDGADLGGWRAWVDYPIALAGRGGVRAWFGLDNGRAVSATARVALSDVVTRLRPDLPELHLQRASGELSLHRGSGGMTLATRALTLVPRDAPPVRETELDLRLLGALEGGDGRGELNVNRVDFAALAGLAAHLPFDDSVRARLAAFDPVGHVDEVRLSWRGPVSAPDGWQLKLQFADIGLRPQGIIPGMRGISGRVEGDERSGRVRLTGQGAEVDLPAVFPEPRLALSTLRAEGGWHRRDGRLTIEIDQLAFDNPDAAGTASGRYFPAAEGAGEIDLTARLTRADGGAVWRYLPYVAGDETRAWLRSSLIGGRVPDARLRLKGAIDDFPYRNPNTGQFLVVTRVSGARLNYADGWPAITDIAAEVRFDGPGMRITADSARIFDVALSRVVADVPDLDGPDGAVMTIRGRANGATTDFLRFVSESPVSARIDGFTNHMKAEGRGSLDLQLVLPLNDIDSSTVKGEYRFAGNRLWVVDGLPPLGDAAGTVRFTEKELTIPSARAQLFGEQAQVAATTASDGSVSFTAGGSAAVRVAREHYGWPALDHLSGSARWTAAIDVRAQGTTVQVRSDLAGVASSLPAPLNKSATTLLPLRVDVNFAADGRRHDIDAGIADRVALMLTRRVGAGDAWEIERGGLGLGVAPRVTPGGVMVVGRLDELDVDAWRVVAGSAEGGDAATQRAAPGALSGIELAAGRVRAFGQSLSAVRFDAQADAGGWKGRIVSNEAEGEFDWRNLREGAMRARLKRLSLGNGHGEKTADDDAPSSAEPPRKLPGLDIVAEQFALRGMDLGRLEVQARNRDGVWHLDSVSLANPDGRLTGTGRWRPGPAQRTDLDFRLDVDDIGRMMTRLGYAEAVRDGKAVLGGKLGWRSAPTRIDYPTLTGTISVDAQDGQFRKLDPGAGRLLGVLSLQSLPRRLTLDFRDVFSEGFAFDRISGSIDVASGVMRTDDLQIRGPAARIVMKGSADVEKETQDLRVSVQPTLSESVAIGAAAGLINPVAGVVTYLAQKALSDPIEKLFAFDYAVTGGWADPKVEKISGGEAAGAEKKP